MSLLVVGPGWGFPLWMIVTAECGMIILGTKEDIYQYDPITFYFWFSTL